MPYQKYKTRRRYDHTSHARALTFSCYRSQPLLLTPQACDYLSGALIAATQKYEFHLWAYVFMPEHLHLLVMPLSEDSSVSAFMKSVKQSVSRRFLRYCREKELALLQKLETGRQKEPYHFWQPGGGYDRNIEQKKTLQQVVNYIHRNPVRRGLVENPEDWQWSSYKDWMGIGKGPVPLHKDSFPVI